MSRGVADIASARLALLNAGSVASATLTEGLAIDFTQLLAAAAPAIGGDGLARMAAQAEAGITKRMALAAQLLLEPALICRTCKSTPPTRYGAGFALPSPPRLA